MVDIDDAGGPSSAVREHSRRSSTDVVTRGERVGQPGHYRGSSLDMVVPQEVARGQERGHGQGGVEAGYRQGGGGDGGTGGGAGSGGVEVRGRGGRGVRFNSISFDTPQQSRPMKYVEVDKVSS